MKKSNFVALVLGTLSGMLFAIGMCMALLPEWNAFKPGVVMGIAGIFLGLITISVWRNMEGKRLIHISGKLVLYIIIGIVGALTLGLGMCFCMVWNRMVIGIIIGIVGIAVLLCLVPLTIGIKE